MACSFILRLSIPNLVSRCLRISSVSARFNNMNKKKSELATFGAGCFWHVEETFRTQPGIISTVVGYMGGSLKNPTYEDVCTDKTGHVEVVHIEYDPSRITYEKLLDIFWKNHDPTTLNRQGPDVGTQYRSVIFYHTVEQKKIAQQQKQHLMKSGTFTRPIVTDITKAQPFYKAEEYHQKYLCKKGLQSCNL